jgi:4-amino-4-deoxy-L-arabinose transferase-like glycosyltransferase
MQRSSVVFWVSLTGVLLLSRLCHVNVLWSDEDYHLAAAIQMLHGKMLYRDLWYDKPPLNAIVAALFGAWFGWPLRIAGTVLAVASCAVAFRFGSGLWSRREGYWAAGLLAFSLIFYLPFATIPLEPDTLMILPHVAAVYLAWRQKPMAAGLAAGLAFAMNTKGLAVLVACLIFAPTAWPVFVAWMLAGFLIPNALLLGWIVSQHAFSSYVESVWLWGLLYAGAPPDALPGGSALMSLRNWSGFHAALVLAAAWYWVRTKETRLRAQTLGWAIVSLAAAGVGWRFSPHYLNQMLPPLAIAGSRGIFVLSTETRMPLRRLGAIAIIAAALVAIIRFGPRYFLLAADDLAGRPHAWRDVALDQESRQVSALIRASAQEGDTIFIWGYRPNIVVYTRLPVASRMWESQPLTGVPADRHLRESGSVDPDWARQNRAEMLRSFPTSPPSIIVDGLSGYNSHLDIGNYPDLAAWFKRYCLAGRVGLTTVYRLCAER